MALVARDSMLKVASSFGHGARHRGMRAASPVVPVRRAPVCMVHRHKETPEQAEQRRIQESLRVEQRVVDVTGLADWQRETKAAGSKLMVVEVESERLCQTGLAEEAELQWKEEQQAALLPCANIKHTFARTARDCPDVCFLSINADDEDSQPLLDHLGIDVVPTVQFWRAGHKLWEHKGVVALEQDLGEGVMYFGDAGANGLHPSEIVRDLHTEAELTEFVTPTSDEEARQLTVVDVSLGRANPCIHIYPAVVALARSFKGYAKFGRLMGDESHETQQLLAKFNIVEVPTFLFFKGGKEVMRHVGSSRGDLIGKILEVQGAFGVPPPPPPARAAQPRRGITRTRA